MTASVFGFGLDVRYYTFRRTSWEYRDMMMIIDHSRLTGHKSFLSTDLSDVFEPKSPAVTDVGLTRSATTMITDKTRRVEKMKKIEKLSYLRKLEETKAKRLLQLKQRKSIEVGKLMRSC